MFLLLQNIANSLKLLCFFEHKNFLKISYFYKIRAIAITKVFVNMQHP